MLFFGKRKGIHHQRSEKFLSRRALRCEALEERQMLSITAFPSEIADNQILFDGSQAGTIEVALSCVDYSFETLEGTVEELTAEGLTTAGASGSPELPQKLLRIALPADTDLESVQLTIISGAESTVSGLHDLAPGPVAYTYASASDTDFLMGEELTTSSELVLANPDLNIVDGRDVDVYSTDAFIGEAYCTLVGVQQMGRWKIAEVAYSPFSYNPVTDEVLAIESGSLQLTFDAGSPISSDLMSLTHWDADAAELLDNFDEAIAWYDCPQPVSMASATAADASTSTTANFVILTTDAIVSGSGVLDDYVAMKEQLGWSVYVATESDWGGGTGDAASENIRAWLQANYASMGIEYVMLVGNPDPNDGDVPMKMVWPDGDEYPTDCYYADLTSNWNSDGDIRYGEWSGDITSIPIHEVLVGRMPVYDADYETLDSILNKTMAYQSEDDTAWRENIMIPIAVNNYEYYQYPDYRTDGVGVANALASVAQTNGFDTFKLYEKEGVSPTPESCDLPNTRENLTDHWSSTPTGLVSWHSHGSATSVCRVVWTEDTNSNGNADSDELSWPDFFVSSDATLLDNMHPSVVFEASCNNAWPENSGNLAYSLLANGAIGTFAATRVTSSPYHRYESRDDKYGGSTSYAVHVPSNFMKEPTTRTLASSLQGTRESLGTSGYGLYDLNCFWPNCVAFNLYGDPTVTLLNPTSTPGAVFGTVWCDSNGDGTLDSTETNGIAEATVFLDSNANGQYDFGELYTISDSEGRYALGGLADGTYSVVISLPDNYVNTGNTAQSITITGGIDQLDLDFGGFLSGTITGSVVVDLNGNEICDTTEVGLAGITITLDAVLGQYDATTTTDVDGYYSFQGLPEGTYDISYTTPPGYVQIGGSQRTATLPYAAEVTVDLPVRLPPEESGILSGYCWYDVEASGTWDTATESGMNGQTVFLDLDSNGVFDETDPWMLSSNDSFGNPGFYQFSSLPPGEYSVGIATQDQWTQTSPAAVYTVMTTAGSEQTDLDFGVVFTDTNAILVSTEEDADDGDLTFGNLSLREALRIAGERMGDDIIRFAPTLTGQAIAIDPTLGTFVVDSNLEIIGIEDLPQTTGFDERVMLDALDACTVVSVADNMTVSISSLIVTGGNATESTEVLGTTMILGGGIYGGSNVYLSLNDMIITGNYSIHSGCGVGMNEGATLSVFDSIIENGSGGGGGAIFTWGDLAVTNTIISGNSTDSNGAGIYCYYATLSVTDSTFTNNRANAYNGGGICGYQSSMTITNSTFSNNFADNDGGGIANFSGALTIANSIFSRNTAGDGGGIYSRSYDNVMASTAVENCTFLNNTADGDGGGIVNWSGPLTVVGTTFNDNVTGDDGGGIYFYDPDGTGSTSIASSIFSNNAADDCGGGIASFSGVLTIESSTIDNNLACYGGGIRFSDSGSTATLFIANSTVSNNSALQGGGIDLLYENSSATIVNSIITNNHASDSGCPLTGRGGAIRAWDATSIEIVNTLIADNTSENYSPGLFLHNSPLIMTNSTVVNNISPSTSYGAGIHLDSSTATVCNSVVTDNGDAPDVGGSLSGSSKNNLISQVVAFVDAANGDYRLLEGSPAIDAGDNALVPAEITTDLDGNAHIANDTVDIGAYEFIPEPSFIPGDANGDGRVDGSDVTILAGNWQHGVTGDPNATWNMGDFNGDGKVDGFDVTILAGNWQAGVSSTVVAVSAPTEEEGPTTHFTPPASASLGVATVPRRESLPPRRFITPTPEASDAALAESTWTETDYTAIAKDLTPLSAKKSTAASDELFALGLDRYADIA